MNKELKQKIKNEVKEIIDEINYEEYLFNRVFHSNVEFEKYGKEAYLKYVPYKYKTQELKNLIKEKNFVEIYEHYGVTTLQKLEYTSKLANREIHTKNKFKLFFIKLKKILSGKFIFLPTQTILALPEGISNISNEQNNVVDTKQ